jgi:hypothetical protein
MYMMMSVRRCNRGCQRLVCWLSCCKKRRWERAKTLHTWLDDNVTVHAQNTKIYHGNMTSGALAFVDRGAGLRFQGFRTIVPKYTGLCYRVQQQSSSSSPFFQHRWPLPGHRVWGTSNLRDQKSEVIPLRGAKGESCRIAMWAPGTSTRNCRTAVSAREDEGRDLCGLAGTASSWQACRSLPPDADSNEDAT